MSGGTGDDASHLIGARFGAPGGSENLSLGNWKTNRHGTYKNLEDYWAEKRKKGVDVKVTDVTRKGENRPYMRNVQRAETARDGTQTNYELNFANTHTDKSRENQHVPETTSGNETDNVIQADFKNKQR